MAAAVHAIGTDHEALALQPGNKAVELALRVNRQPKVILQHQAQKHRGVLLAGRNGVSQGTGARRKRRAQSCCGETRRPWRLFPNSPPLVLPLTSRAFEIYDATLNQ